MLATLADAPLRDPHLVYEPKYDGIRALVTVTPGVRGAAVAIASRLGNDKTAQFPEIVQALEAWARGRRQAVVLDGEIVALDGAGQPLGFGRLQPRIHLTGGKDVARLAATQPVALFVFDLLREGDEDLCKLPLSQRRERLEATFAPAREPRDGVIRLSRQVAGDGEALMAEAQAAGWEGLIAKDARSLYRPGRRTADWRKLKLVKRQEFVVGGWTEPRGSRHRFGALLLGLPAPDGRLRYVGHVGGGFSEEALRAVGARLDALAQQSCPFETAPPSNDKPHWVRPALVVEVRFGEWTEDGNLRHPVFLGLRDDVVPTAIARETGAPAAREELLVKKSASGRSTSSPSAKKRAAATAPKVVPADGDTAAVLESLAALEERGSGRLTLPSGDVLELGNLKKVLWPELGITKGELLRYYVTIAPLLLPVVRDRPSSCAASRTGSRARPSISTARPTTCRPACAPSRCRETPTCRRASSAARSRRCST